MGTGYAIAYRLGVTPWERAGEAAAAHFGRLLDREEDERSRPLGRAVDLGCGTGAHAVDLAARGWDVTGIDNVARAVEKAQQRCAGGPARCIVGDVTALAGTGLAPGVDFFLDVGCFHGLSDEERQAYGSGVTALAGPGATLLMLAFQAGRRIGLPRGADRRDLEEALPGWSVVSVDAADTSGMPAPLRKTSPQWYRLRRE